MLVKNNWKRPIRVGRQVIIKDAVENIPEHLLLQPRIQKLRQSGKLIFPFNEIVEMPEPSNPLPISIPQEIEKKEDDLSTLIHVGENRVKALNAFGIFTFAQVAEHKGTLHEILETTKHQAAEIAKDAEKKAG
jgi:hypothetical protein